jgi:hypothetical protein
MFTKNLYFYMLVALFLIAGSSMAAWAQSAKAIELQTYLQQLEQDKLQYKNNPSRYQEYEHKIAAIRAELGEQGIVSNIANTTTDSKGQPAETEQARMARTLSSDDYAKWKMAQNAINTPDKQPEQSKVSASNKGTRVMASPTAKMNKQQLGGVKITTRQNAQTTTPRERSANGAKKEMSAAKKAIYQKYGLTPNTSKDEMITWRKDNPTKWQAMRQELQNEIKTQQK